MDYLKRLEVKQGLMFPPVSYVCYNIAWSHLSADGPQAVLRRTAVILSSDTPGLCLLLMLEESPLHVCGAETAAALLALCPGPRCDKRKYSKMLTSPSLKDRYQVIRVTLGHN